MGIESEMLLDLTTQELYHLLDKSEITFSVFGLGRVGLPLAVAWLQAGQVVIGVDVNPEIVGKINRRISPARADTRNSPSYELVEILGGYGTEIFVHDPLIEKDEILEEMGIPLIDSLEEAFSSASLIVVATDHEIYSELDLNEIVGLVDKPAVIIDGRNMIKTSRVPRDLIITGIGKKSFGL